MTFEKHTQFSNTCICQVYVLIMAIRCYCLRQIQFLPIACNTIYISHVSTVITHVISILHSCSTNVLFHFTQIIPRNSTRNKSCKVKTCNISCTCTCTALEVQKRTQNKISSTQTRISRYCKYARI